jgi:hypothetical protein
MDLISSIFPCVQRRKPLRCPAQEQAQNGIQAESEASNASSAASRTAPNKTSQRMSVRIVEAVDSQTTICPEEPGNDHDELPETFISHAESRDADAAWEKEGNVRVIHMDLCDTPTATAPATHRQEQAPSREPRIPTLPLPPKAAKLPEVKSRMIENIPEEDDEYFANANTSSFESPTEKPSREQETETDTPRDADAKRNSTWRESSRKSLVDIINLLQSTTSDGISTLRVHSLKWPLPPRSPHRPRPSTALSCRSSSSFSSAVTATIEFDKPNPITKKERRMGAAILPTIRLGPRKWSDDDGINTKGPLFE